MGYDYAAMGKMKIAGVFAINPLESVGSILDCKWRIEVD